MALVNTDVLRDNYETLVERLASDPGAGIVRPVVSTKLVKDVTVESTFEQYDRHFTFYSDEAESRGGQERGPSPMRYFLSGIAFCMQGWYAKGSAFAGCELDVLEMDVRTYMDMRGEHAFEDVPPHPQWLVFDIRVTSPSSSDSVLEMIDWGDARCPLGSLVRRSVPVYERVTHNEKVIRDTVPEEAR